MNEETTSEEIEDTNLDGLTDFMDQFKIHGRTISEWDDILTLPLNINANRPTGLEIREAYLAYSDKIQTAGHLYSITKAMYISADSTRNSKKVDIIRKMVQEYETNRTVKPPAKVLEQLAEQRTSEYIATKITLEIIKEFFAQKIETLHEVRKSLDQISISMNIELKYLEGGST